MPTVEELEAILRRHVIDVWFPRCLDVEYGGFLCDFDRRWRRRGPHQKLIEFQARQTLLAAEALQFAPDDERLRRAAIDGFRFLRDVMWDRRLGGWFHRTDRYGEPLEARTKHAHGMAYGIEACVAVHTATGEAGALNLAREGFAWLEQYARDKHHGGYFGFLKQDGEIIRNPSECPWPTETDAIGTPIGLKDSNVHTDLLQTFTSLYRVWPDPKVAERLNEIVRILCDKVITSAGGLFYFCQPDWTPVPDLMRYGDSFQGAHRLLAARDLVGSEDQMIDTARRLVDLVLRCAWDRTEGGFFYAGPASALTRIEGSDIVVRNKAWWIQFEALRALLSLSFAAADGEAYFSHFETQWRYLQRHMIDSQHGGVYSVGLEGLPRWRRRLGASFAPAAFTRKGSVWKDGSHDGRALLYCLSALRANAQG